MINDKKLQDLMAEAVKVRQSEIMEKINRRMEKMYQEKKKQLTIQALTP
jgi:polyhydroxyalkanoate synthesis regulator phasin